MTEETEALRALVEAQRAYDEALRALNAAHRPDMTGANPNDPTWQAWEGADARLRKATEDLTLAGRELRNARGRRHGRHAGHDEG